MVTALPVAINGLVGRRVVFFLEVMNCGLQEYTDERIEEDDADMSGRNGTMGG